MFYVYEWFVKNSGEVFYVGKGCKKRYLQTAKRNKLFQLYYDKFDCSVRIIKDFDTEDDAFAYEHTRIMKLKAIGQAVCNLDYGGKGGCNFVWTNEMREYKSQYNPMKAIEQRKRMQTNNPMKNRETSEKVNAQKRRAVIIDGVKYDGVIVASKAIGVLPNTISRWCNKGYNTKGKPCRYADEPQKDYPSIKITHPYATTPKAVIVDGKRFETVKDAAQYIGVWSESLIRAIKQNKLCKGHKCEYDNQQPSTNLNG